MTLSPADSICAEMRALSAKVKTKRCYWIVTPDGDLGTEWCWECGYYKLRNLRHRDKKRRTQYFLDGGWPTEHDHQPFCENCGALLEGSLTTFAACNELAHYAESGFQAGSEIEAYHLEQMLDALPDDHMQDGIDIARNFIAECGLHCGVAA